MVDTKGHVFLVDLGSMHGTHIEPANGAPIKLKARAPVQVLNGDTLIFGKAVDSKSEHHQPVRVCISFRYNESGPRDATRKAITNPEFATSKDIGKVDVALNGNQNNSIDVSALNKAFSKGLKGYGIEQSALYESEPEEHLPRTQFPLGGSGLAQMPPSGQVVPSSDSEDEDDDVIEIAPPPVSLHDDDIIVISKPISVRSTSVASDEDNAPVASSQPEADKAVGAEALLLEEPILDCPSRSLSSSVERGLSDQEDIIINEEDAAGEDDDMQSPQYDPFDNPFGIWPDDLAIAEAESQAAAEMEDDEFDDESEASYSGRESDWHSGYEDEEEEANAEHDQTAPLDIDSEDEEDAEADPDAVSSEYASSEEAEEGKDPLDVLSDGWGEDAEDDSEGHDSSSNLDDEDMDDEDADGEDIDDEDEAPALDASIRQNLNALTFDVFLRNIVYLATDDSDADDQSEAPSEEPVHEPTQEAQPAPQASAACTTRPVVEAMSPVFDFAPQPNMMALGRIMSDFPQSANSMPPSPPLSSGTPEAESKPEESAPLPVGLATPPSPRKRKFSDFDEATPSTPEPVRQAAVDETKGTSELQVTAAFVPATPAPVLVDAGTQALPSPVATPERPSKIRRIVSAVSLVALGAAIGSAGTIAGLLQLAD